jgi:predicted membrane-bound mannosyltransferase
VFDLVMFPILYIHYKKPQIAWLVTSIIVPLFILIVQMPLDKIK